MSAATVANAPYETLSSTQRRWLLALATFGLLVAVSGAVGRTLR